MKPYRPPSKAQIVASYAVCRRGGAPPGLARVELELPAEIAAQLERVFQRQAHAGGEMRPRFARHAAHVRAVVEQGGYPALPEARR